MRVMGFLLNILRFVRGISQSGARGLYFYGIPLV
jgi:hypothetical protein